MADRAQSIGIWPGLGVAILLVALTLGTVGVVATTATGGAGLQASDWSAIRFTLLQATLSAVLSVGLAIPVARALARRRFAGRGVFIALLGVPFILPVIVAVLGLLLVYGRGGLANAFLVSAGFEPFNIYGLKGVVLAHVFFNLPLAARLFLQGWQAIPAEHFRLAAQLGMSTKSINRRLEGPMLRAVAPGALVTVFLLSVTSFAVALTLGGGPRATTIELAIYQAFRFDFDLPKAAVLAAVQFLIGMGAAGLAWKFAIRSNFGPGMGAPLSRWDCCTRGARMRDMAILAAVAVFLILPLGMIIASGLAGLTALPLENVVEAALRSTIVALVSALLTLGLSLALCRAITAVEGSHPGVSAALEVTGYLSLAASPMIIGTGLFILVFPLLDPVSLALPLTALVNATMSLPFAIRTLLPAIRASEADYARLADSLGMTPQTRFRLVTWPRIRPVAGFAAGLAAALSMGDLGVITLFADPASATLPLVLYRLMGSYQMAAANAAALILVSMSFAMFWALDRGIGGHA